MIKKILGNKKIIVVVVAVLLLMIASIAGIIPMFSILDTGTSTINKDFGGMSGSGELLGPNDRKGYITSWKNDGFSETITVIGKIQVNTWSLAGVASYTYEVYGKKIGGSYVALSTPDETSMYISNPNPGIVIIPGTISTTGGIYNMDAYSFEVVGSDYIAIKVIFKGFIDWNLLNPLDDGYQWRPLQTDEAYLYEGYGSLNLPLDADNRPRDNFEIGETVDIRVETAKGGQTVDGEGTWRVTLNEPYSGGITDPGTGGGVVKEEYYNDDVTNGHFIFTVTEEMAQKSMDSPDPYSIRIWNTILPMGTLYTDFVDFNMKCPGDVELSGPTQSKVDSSATVSFSADVNSDTQLSIDYFRVSVIYGPSNVLLPSDPNSHNWIVRTTNMPATNNAGSISFIPAKESYVTVHVKAFDTEGRGSPRTRTWTLWAYAEAPADDEAISDETGDHDYGGGHTDPWFSWDPSGGNWDKLPKYSLLGILIIVLVIILSLVAAMVLPIQLQFKLLIVVIGVIIALLLYFYFFTSVFA